jgi:ubiquinone/menaquinone biosynthesis C-methylase UbiE
MSPASRAAVEKQEKLARAYDTDVWPIYAGRFAEAALRVLAPRPAARVVEVGCATGLSTLELARKLGADARVSAFDEAPAAVALARARVEGDAQARGRVTLEVAAPTALPVADREADVAVSNLAVAEADDPPAAVRELARTLAPGGQAVITLALRGTWGEFLDVYRDVLREQGKRDSAGALERYVAALPDGDSAARWLQAAGLENVEVAALRWEILFKSTREFFFAPLVELGPLSRWKQIAGRGDDMQDIFFFTKEALDAYFKGTVLPMTVVGATVTGKKPG